MIPAVLQDPMVRRILGKALDRLDRLPPDERTLAVQIPIDSSTAPEIFAADTVEDRDLAWHALDMVEKQGIGKIEYRKAVRHGSRQDRKPVLRLSAEPEVEARLRTIYERPRPGPKYADIWRSAVDGLELPNSVADALREQPIAIKGRSAQEIAIALAGIRADRDRNGDLLLREVASRYFWGLSKALDTRTDLLATLLECQECPYPEQPIHLSVHLPAAVRGILFVENKTSFERCCRSAADTDHPVHGLAIVYAGGFMGTARRLHAPGQVRMFYAFEETPTAEAVAGFLEKFYGASVVPVFFWGDLDHAGMEILHRLRTIFVDARAWEPGYAPMMEKLQAGAGHLPEEARKLGQRQIATTGCAYADGHLLPAIAAAGRFIDQE